MSTIEYRMVDKFGRHGHGVERFDQPDVVAVADGEVVKITRDTATEVLAYWNAAPSYGGARGVEDLRPFRVERRAVGRWEPLD